MFTNGYTYDAGGRLKTLTSPAGAFTYTYTYQGAGGLIQKLVLPSGAYVTNTFDAMARLANTTLKSSAHGVLNSHAYLYNPQGWVTNQTRTDGSFAGYGYDKIGQLKSALGKESGGASRLHEQLSYAYDPAGNLTKRTNNALCARHLPSTRSTS